MDPLETKDIFSQFPHAQWSVGGVTIAFPVESLSEDGSNRLAQHLRIYRDGARLDDMGAGPIQWEITTSFYNSEIHEAGLTEPQYPDAANALTDSFRKHETGDLTLPTRGPVRARAMRYRRVESTEQRDCCAMVLTFLEDNEDDETTSSWASASAAGALPSAVDEFMSAADAAGAVSDSLQSLAGFASDLEDLATAPQDYLGDLEELGADIERQCQNIEDSFATATTSAANEVTNLFAAPDKSLAIRKLREVRDKAAIATFDKTGRKQTVSVTYQQNVSIFEVAADYGQASDALIRLNSSLPDLLDIAAGTAIKVYAE